MSGVGGQWVVGCDSEGVVVLIWGIPLIILNF